MATLGTRQTNSPISNNVRRHILKCNGYVSTLPLISQYCIWRYTAGSASVNMYLITGNITANAKYWTYLFFKLAANSIKMTGPLEGHNTATQGVAYSTGGEPSWDLGEFSKYKAMFDAAKSDDAQWKSQITTDVAEDVIKIYISVLTGILDACPVVDGWIRVYKISSKYPGLPEKLSMVNGDNIPVVISQAPFNSSTIDDGFNFSLFAAKDAYGQPIGDNSIFWKLYLEPGTRGCLYIPDHLHAYGFEKEIMLNRGLIFSIETITNNATLGYVDQRTVTMDNFQSGAIDKISMGSVYQPNTYFPCGSAPCMKQLMTGVTIFEAIVELAA